MRLRVEVVNSRGELERRPVFSKREVVIGRKASNDLVLPDSGVSGTHARLLVTGGALTLLDLGSTNGTFVNRERLEGPRTVGESDEVQMGEFRLRFALDDGQTAVVTSQRDARADEGSSPTRSSSDDRRASDLTSLGKRPPEPPMLDEVEPSTAFVEVPRPSQPGSALFPAFDTRVVQDQQSRTPDDAADAALGRPVQSALHDTPRAAPPEDPITELLALEPRELLVQGTIRMRLNQNGHVSEGPSPFTSHTAIRSWVQDRTGRPFGGDAPTARGVVGHYGFEALDAGAATGPVLCLRRRTPQGATSLDELAHQGQLSTAMAKVLRTCAQARLNMLLCVGPGAQARQLISALLACGASSELQVVLTHPGVDASQFAPGTVVVARNEHQETVQCALALAPDRLAVEDLQWSEAAAIPGIMTRPASCILGIRAATAKLGLEQLTARIRSTGSPEAMLAHAIDVIVVIHYFSDGVSRVTQIAEPLDDLRRNVREVYSMTPGTRNWVFSGETPSWATELSRRGFSFDASSFDTSTPHAGDEPEAHHRERT